MLTDEKVKAFLRDGYVLGGRVLDDAAVAVLQDEVLRVIADRDQAGLQPVVVRNIARNAQAGREIWQIVNIWEASDPFRALVHDPAVVAAVATLTAARELRLWHDQIQYKPAESGGVNMWHQDGPYWPILEPKTQVTAWVALDDVDEDNGCMSMVPASHRWEAGIDFLHSLADFGAMPSEWGGHRIEVRRAPVRKGHVHFHHALTWHGSHENRSGRPRRAVALHYMTEETRFVASGTHLMKPFVTVPDGAKLEGDRFPLVWRDGKPLPPPAKEAAARG